MPSRRELILALLGLPLAGGCRRARRTVPGALLGQSMGVGHRLRDATPERATGPARRARVVIVGAGPSGLAAAWRLQRRGFPDFAILELEPHAGGTSAYGTDGVVPYPWGAHYVPVPMAHDEHLVALLREVGAVELDAVGTPVGHERALVREPEDRLFVGGAWHPGLWPATLATDEDQRQLAAFDREVRQLAGRRDARGRRSFALPTRLSSDDEELTRLDRIPASRWLSDRGLTSPLLRAYVDHACRDDYGLTVEQTSAWAMLFYFGARLPASDATTEPFLSFPEGNGRIVRHLAGVVGARLHLGRMVTDVVPGAEGVVVAALDVATGKLERWEAEEVVLAIPKFIAARVLRPWRDSPPPGLRDVEHGAWLVANLHLRRRPRSLGVPLAWDNVVHGSASLGYVAATHQALRDRGPTVFTWYLPLTDDDPRRAREKLAALDHATAVDLVLTDLGPAHLDLEDCIERIDAWRWGHAMPLPRPGVTFGAARRAVTKAAPPRVHLAHTDLSAMALLEEALDHGVTAADHALAALRPGGATTG